MEKDIVLTIPRSSFDTIPQRRLVNLHFISQFSDIVREVFYNEQQADVEQQLLEEIEREIGITF